VVTLFTVLVVAVCTASLRGLEVDALDRTAKGEGETDEEASATGGSGQEVRLSSVSKALSARNRGIR
jgi:hypothetical protein